MEQTFSAQPDIRIRRWIKHNVAQQELPFSARVTALQFSNHVRDDVGADITSRRREAH